MACALSPFALCPPRDPADPQPPECRCLCGPQRGFIAGDWTLSPPRVSRGRAGQLPQAPHSGLRQSQTKVAWWGLALALAAPPELRAGRSEGAGLLASGREGPGCNPSREAELVTPVSLVLAGRPRQLRAPPPVGRRDAVRGRRPGVPRVGCREQGLGASPSGSQAHAARADDDPSRPGVLSLLPRVAPSRCHWRAGVLLGVPHPVLRPVSWRGASLLRVFRLVPSCVRGPVWPVGRGPRLEEPRLCAGGGCTLGVPISAVPHLLPVTPTDLRSPGGLWAGAPFLARGRVVQCVTSLAATGPV